MHFRKPAALVLAAAMLVALPALPGCGPHLGGYDYNAGEARQSNSLYHGTAVTVQEVNINSNSSSRQTAGGLIGAIAGGAVLWPPLAERCSAEPQASVQEILLPDRPVCRSPSATTTAAKKSLFRARIPISLPGSVCASLSAPTDPAASNPSTDLLRESYLPFLQHYILGGPDA